MCIREIYACINGFLVPLYYCEHTSNACLVPFDGQCKFICSEMLDFGEKTGDFDAANKHRWKLNSLWNEHDTKLQYLPFSISPRSSSVYERAHEMTLTDTTFRKFNINNDLLLFYS